MNYLEIIQDVSSCVSDNYTHKVNGKASLAGDYQKKCKWLLLFSSFITTLFVCIYFLTKNSSIFQLKPNFPIL